MRHRLAIAGILSLIAFASSTAIAAEPKVGEKATFSYKTTDGKDVTPESLAGHIVILDFWATWCGPCMAMGPHMVDLNKAYAASGVTIIGVSLDKDVKHMADVAAEKGFAWPQICDGKGWASDFAKAWEVRGIPHCVILSPDGTVLWSGHPNKIDGPLKDAVQKFSKGGLPASLPAPLQTPSPSPTVAPARPAKSSTPTHSLSLVDMKFSQAESDRKAGRKFDAYEGYQWILSQGSGTASAKFAQEQIAACDADETFAPAYQKFLRERDASRALGRAQGLEKSGKPDLAKTCYAKIVTDFGETASAPAAKEALTRLN